MWLSTIGLLITLILGLLATPLTIEAQQAGKVYPIVRSLALGNHHHTAVHVERLPRDVVRI